MAQKKLEKLEPHFNELVILFERKRERATKGEIYDQWAKSIKPDVPQITLGQFNNWTNRYRDSQFEKELARTQSHDIENLEVKRAAGLIEIEQTLRGTADGLLKDAANTMQLHNSSDEGVSLRERFFALQVVDKMWGRVQKEKEIAIKAHAEKRESVGMFAKLLRGALSGEFTMKDVEMLKNNYGDTVPTIEGAAERTPQVTA